jgi:hypothetical protein
MQTSEFLSFAALIVLLSAQALAQDRAADPGSQYCMSGVELLTEDDQLVADALNSYFQKARLPPEEVDAICRHPDDSMRIYLAYRKALDVGRVSVLADGASIHVAGTMVQMQGCWFLLIDSGFQLAPEALPSNFMRVGQRIELTLSEPLSLGETDSGQYPTYQASDPRLSDWGIQPTEFVTSFELEVQRALEELAFGATVSIDGTGAFVSGMNSDQITRLEESLREDFGMFMVTEEQDGVYFWPDLRVD